MSEEREKIEQLSAQVAALSYAVGIAMGSLDVIYASGHSISAKDAMDVIRQITHPIFYPSVMIPLPANRLEGMR